jgi:hypothetical protein
MSILTLNSPTSTSDKRLPGPLDLTSAIRSGSPVVVALATARVNLDPVVPLQASENRWDRKAIQVDKDSPSPELIERKVKGLLTVTWRNSLPFLIAWVMLQVRER